MTRTRLGHFAAHVIREPLLQFALLGALLFVMDRYAVGSAEDPRRIVIDAARRQELVSVFEEGQGRKPGPEELQQLIVKWSQSEVLYREARLMGLDQGDEMIRERLITKLRSVLFNSIVADVPAEAELRSWFEAHRALYDRPESFDFAQFFVSEPGTGVAAQALALELGTGSAPAERAEGVRTYEARPAANLAAIFGEEHARALVESPEGRWLAVSSPKGWHLARILRRHPAQPADFAELVHRVARDWKDQAQKADLAGALKSIVSHYEIEVTPDREGPRAELPRADAVPRAEARR